MANPTQCDLGAGSPQLLAVDRPFVRRNTAGDTRTVTVTGFGFGAAKGVLTLGTTTVATTSWTDTKIVFTVPPRRPSVLPRCGSPTPPGCPATTA